MTDDKFENILTARLGKITSILGRKAVEYARGDRLSNFKRAATIMQCSPEQACISFWMKHVTSILDLVNDINDGKADAGPEMWDEKIGDAINYLILLEAIVKERLQAAELNKANP